MTTYPSEQEMDAMAAFLAATGEPSEVRSRLWQAVVELINSRPPKVVEQMEMERGIK